MPNIVDNRIIIKKTKELNLEKLKECIDERTNSFDFRKICSYDLLLKHAEDGENIERNLIYYLLTELGVKSNVTFTNKMYSFEFPVRFDNNDVTDEEIANLVANLISIINSNIKLGESKYTKVSEIKNKLLNTEFNLTAIKRVVRLFNNTVKDNSVLDINFDEIDKTTAIGKMALITLILTGYVDSYNYTLNNIGNKWIIPNLYSYFENDEFIQIYFGTAWSPIIEGIEMLSKAINGEIYYQYNELGNFFAGEAIITPDDTKEERYDNDGFNIFKVLIDMDDSILQESYRYDRDTDTIRYTDDWDDFHEKKFEEIPIIPENELKLKLREEFDKTK